jgi:hypothetical protein
MTKKATKDNLDNAFGPYKTDLTLSTALRLMVLPVVIRIGDDRWILADYDQKHLDALTRLWRTHHKDEWAYVETIPKEVSDTMYERGPHKVREKNGHFG